MIMLGSPPPPILDSRIAQLKVPCALVASADRTNLLRLNLKANSSFRIPKNQPPDFARSESSSNSRGCNQLHSQLPSECNNFQSTRVYGDYQLKIPNWISLGPVTLG